MDLNSRRRDHSDGLNPATPFGQNTLPFHLIQLPRIGGDEPIRQHWPEYRKVQADVARKLPDVHLIVTQHPGWDSPDVHPPDKLPVAKRLAEAISE